MAKINEARLIRAAVKARKLACAPYSRFNVGAALLAGNNRIFTGANVESASYGLTCCAERVALFSALTRGARGFKAIAIVARHPGGPMPCGACRQLLSEYAGDATVLVCDSMRPGKWQKYTVRQLLPGAFLTFASTSV
jgi:cytidine deaminase